EYPLDVPGHGDEAPFAARAREAAQRKLTETQRRFDDPEHRLRHLLAQRVKRPACRRRQPMRHRLDRRWILRRFRRLEALGQGRMMRLTAHGDQRFDPRLVASRDVRRAEIAGIRQQAFGLAQFVGKSLDLVQHRFELLLVVGAWLTALATTSRLPAATAAWAL